MKKEHFYGTGKRKTSVARVFIKLGSGNVIVNNLLCHKYFIQKSKIFLIYKPLNLVKIKYIFDVLVNVHGGGKSSQADAICHGISKALLNYDKNLKVYLSHGGFLTRDARCVERKKVGLHKARRAKQFSKR